MASISACPPPPYSRTSAAELAHTGSAAKQQVPGPVDLLAWELGAVTEAVETENTYGLITSISRCFLSNIFLPMNIIFQSKNVMDKLSTLACF